MSQLSYLWNKIVSERLVLARENIQHPEELFQNRHSIRRSFPMLKLPVDALIYWLIVIVLKLIFSTLWFIYWTVTFRPFQSSKVCWNIAVILRNQRVNTSTIYYFAKFSHQQDWASWLKVTGHLARNRSGNADTVSFPILVNIN